MSESESRTGTPVRASARSGQQARNPRLRLACLRCQRRKIKCDGELPRCKHCRNAGAACIDGESARLRDLPRGYMTNLRDRVKWLEAIVQEKCPDVDLSQGPAYDDASLQNLLRDETPTKGNDTVATAAEPGETRNTSSHDIGLVSLGTSQDQRYIGPSSGYFLARVMLTKSSLQATASTSRTDHPLATELIETVQRPATLPSREIAEQICDAYFDTMHFAYPVLHRPTFMNMLSQLYPTQQDAEPALAFQVYMVLAIGSIAMSHRLKTRLPSESFCLAALQYFHRLNVENSLQGLQSLILLLIFTLHSPHTRVNIWYLNYQAIAAVVDLGLQREITTQSGISLLEQEMRTRIFWVVFMLDRVIATTMGRPIGLRDEACDLRLPRELDDATLSMTNTADSNTSGRFTPISYSIHLFRLAKLNSEIKYVANSVVRQTPVYAYPSVVDIFDWQNNMLEQLKTWESQIPVGDGSPTAQRLDITCRLQCHTLRLVLLRPSPAIPKPTKEALEACHSSARANIHLLNKLYTRSMLIHSWLTFYAAVLSTLTMLYCVKMVPSIRQKTDVPDFIEDLGIASSILSATGEHWSGARKCRDILDELGRSMTRDLLNSSSETQSSTRPQQSTRRRSKITQRQSTATATAAEAPTPESDTPMLFQPQWEFGADGMAYSQMMEPSAFFDDFLGSESFTSYFNDEDAGGIDDVVRGMFGDFAGM